MTDTDAPKTNKAFVPLGKAALKTERKKKQPNSQEH